MASEAKSDEIKALQRRLRDVFSEDEQVPTSSASVEDLGIHLNPKAARPYTRATAKAGHTQALIACTSQSNEGGHDKSDSIEMTLSREESSSDSGFRDRLETKTSTLPHSSPPDPLTSQWCINVIHTIYVEDVQQTEWGKPGCSIYQESRVIPDRLECVPGLQDMMIRYGLQWLT